MTLTLQEMLELSVQEILDLERDARGSAFTAIMWYQDYGRAKAYLKYADALAEYAAHIKNAQPKRDTLKEHNNVHTNTGENHGTQTHPNL